MNEIIMIILLVVLWPVGFIIGYLPFELLMRRDDKKHDERMDSIRKGNYEEYKKR